MPGDFDFSDPFVLGSKEEEFERGYDLGILDARAKMKPRFQQAHSEFAKGYAKGHKDFKEGKSGGPETGLVVA